MTLTCKVTLDSYSVNSYLFDIRDPKNLQNKKMIIALASLEPEIKKITLRVTWPWRARSCLIVTVWIHIYSTSATLKSCKTKKKIIALASLELEIWKVTLRVTWPWRTGSRLKATVWIHVYLSSMSKIYFQNSSQIISLAYPGPNIGTVMWKLLRKSAWPWISRSRFNDNTSKLWFLQTAAFST